MSNLSEKQHLLTLSNLLFYLVAITIAVPQISSIKAVFFVLFFMYMVLRSTSSENIIPKGYMVCLAGFVLYSYLSKFWAVYPKAASETIMNCIWSIMLNFSMIMFIVINKIRVRTLVKMMMPIILGFIVNSIVTGSHNDSMRYHIGSNANVFGMTAGFMFLLVFYTCKKWKWKSFTYNVCAIALVVLVILSGSRKALLNIGIFVCAVLFFETYDMSLVQNLKRAFKIGIVIVIVFAIVMNVDVFYETVGNRIESLFGYFSGEDLDASAFTRDNMKIEAMDLFKKYPLFGCGLNNFKYLSGYNTYSHSNYYELLCCTGMVGIVLYYIPIVLMLIKAFINWKRNVDGSIVPLTIILIFIVNDVGMVSYFSHVDHIFLGVATGILWHNYIPPKLKE